MPTSISQINLPERKHFQQTVDGKTTDLYVLQNNNGIKVAITNYGARIVSLLVKGKGGAWKDVVVGFDSLNGYLKAKEKYFGAIVGRYANRIAKGRFTLEGKEYILATNNGPNHLHGGVKGFSDVVWEITESKPDTAIELTYVSKDGEEGYPGTLTISVRYELTESNGLKISFRATADRTTVINVTNHAFFNLNGLGSGTITNHSLMINADYYTPVDDTSIPLGEIASVAGTPFDFRTTKRIGEHIEQDDVQLKNGKGYDHNFILKKNGEHMTLAATAKGDNSDITLQVYTTEPGMQLYTGNFMEGSHQIKYDLRDDFRTAFCLETQHFPDAPNHPNFPSTVLKPGEVFQSETIFQF